MSVGCSCYQHSRDFAHQQALNCCKWCTVQLGGVAAEALDFQAGCTLSISDCTHVQGPHLVKQPFHLHLLLDRWVGILAWGEGWHNNHHAFEFSARHGLEWWQVDITWMIIKTLQTFGLATNVRLPTEKQKARLAFPKTA